MNPGDLLEVTIERMAFGPNAVARHVPAPGARPVVLFVEGSAPGDRSRVRLKRDHGNYWEADLVEILDPSPNRVTPPCPVFGACGGCQWQHLDYQTQVREKAAILVHQISRATKTAAVEIERILEIHPSASPLGYRSRVQVHGDSNGIGFFRHSSHEIAHTAQCPVASDEINKKWAETLTTERHRLLSQATGKFKIEWTLLENGQLSEAINRKHAALGFTQANLGQNAVLRSIVGSACGKGSSLLELYGGTGNLSQPLQSKFRSIVSVDTHNPGDSTLTKEQVSEPGLHFARRSVESFFTDQLWRDWQLTFDTVLCDPPREGLRGALEGIVQLKPPSLVLVSCDPSTLARDLAGFQREGYSLTGLHLIDMFPQTYHIEAVAKVVRN